MLGVSFSRFYLKHNLFTISPYLHSNESAPPEGWLHQANPEFHLNFLPFTMNQRLHGFFHASAIVQTMMSSQSNALACGLRMALLPVSLVFATLVFGMAWLKETPIFWRNVGGYPLWLRELVLEGFYPSLVMLTILLLLITVSFLTRPSKGLLCLVESFFTISTWVVFLSAGAVVVTNNVSNLIEGRPLHAHPAESHLATAPLFYQLR